MSSVGFDESGVLRDAFATPDLTFTRRNIRWLNQFEAVLNICEMLSDLVAVALAVMAAVIGSGWLKSRNFHAWPTRDTLVLALIASATFILLLDREGAYRRASSLLRVRETERVLRATVFAVCFMVPVLILFRHGGAMSLLIPSMVLVPLIVITEKHAFYFAVRTFYRQGFGTRRVLIYGAGFTGRRVFSAIARSPKLGLESVAVVDDDGSRDGDDVRECAYTRGKSVPVVCRQITRAWLEELNISMLIIAIPSLDRFRFVHVVNEAASAGVEVAFVPNQGVRSDYLVDYEEIDGVLLASFSRPTPRLRQELFKRAFDLLMGMTALLCLSPLLALISLLIKLDSPGPALFVQDRVGKNGRTFSIYKFRTMFVEAPRYQQSPRDSTDDRITNIGRFLRRTSLDEIPQLINVVRGNMSLVGPRPEMPFIVEQYTNLHRERLAVKPGITGVWQLSADRAFMIHENIQYDLYYIRHRNFYMDLAILLHTIVFAMRGV